MQDLQLVGIRSLYSAARLCCLWVYSELHCYSQVGLGQPVDFSSGDLLRYYIINDLLKGRWGYHSHTVIQYHNDIKRL